jgi:hypothetical protein
MTSAPSDFSAAPSAIGYLYQIRLALLLLVRASERPSGEADLLGVSIELFDDVAIEYNGQHDSFIQSKSHIDTQKPLTDGHPDLWKTLRVWIDAMTLPGRSADLTHCLFTTAEAGINSAAYFLRSGDSRNINKAIIALDNAAKASTSESLAPAISAWNALSGEEKEAFAASIHTLDGSVDATEIFNQLGKLLFRHKGASDQRQMMEQLEGWWINRVIAHLYAIVRGRPEGSIRWLEVTAAVDRIISKFGLDELPNEYGALSPDTPINPSADNRLFVEQLRLIAISNPRIRAAIRDHWRAREQRSKWIKDIRVLPEELRDYDRVLFEEWERLADDHCSGIDAADIAAAKAAGQKVLRDVEKLQIQLRSFSEMFLARGSFHILADHPAQIGWHPNWKDECGRLMKKEQDESVA